MGQDAMGPPTGPARPRCEPDKTDLKPLCVQVRQPVGQPVRLAVGRTGAPGARPGRAGPPPPPQGGAQCTGPRPRYQADGHGSGEGGGGRLGGREL